MKIQKIERKELWKFITLSIGASISQIALILVGLSDSIMMGRQSSSGLAAGTLVSSIYNLGLLFCMGMIIPITYKLGSVKYQKDNTEKKKILQGYYQMVIFLTIFVMIFVLGIVKINSYIVKDAIVISLAEKYAIGLLPGVFPWLLFYLIRNILLCKQKVKLTTILSGVSVLLNIGINYVCIYGVGRFKGFGTTGCAIATSITNWIILLLLVFFIRRDRNILPEWKSIFHKKNGEVKEIWKLGIPSGLVFFSEYLIFTVGNTMLSHIGTDSVIAMGIAVAWLNLSYMFPVGLSQVLTEQVAGYISVHEQNNVKSLSRISMWLGFFYSILCGILIVIFRGSLIHIIVGNLISEELYILSERFLFITIGIIIAYNMIVITSGILRGLGDVKTPLFMMFFMYWIVGIGGTLVMTYLFEEYGVLYGMLLGFSLTFAGIYSTYRKKIWRNNGES